LKKIEKTNPKSSPKSHITIPK